MLVNGAQTPGAVVDIGTSCLDVREARIAGAEDYFRRTANCETAQSGAAGEDSSELASDDREAFDAIATGDSPAACRTQIRQRMRREGWQVRGLAIHNGLARKAGHEARQARKSGRRACRYGSR